MLPARATPVNSVSNAAIVIIVVSLSYYYHLLLLIYYASYYVQKYQCENGDTDTPTSAWTSWSLDVNNDLDQRSPSQRSQSPPRTPSLRVPGMTSQPGAHLRCYDDNVTSHDPRGVSPSSNVPTDCEYRLRSPTTPVTAMTCENVSWPALQTASDILLFKYNRYKLLTILNTTTNCFLLRFSFFYCHIYFIGSLPNFCCFNKGYTTYRGSLSSTCFLEKNVVHH